MAHFIIDLPEDIQCKVHYGRVFKKYFNLNPFKKSGPKEEPKIGYLIELNSATIKNKKYMLYKSKDGNWSKDPDGKIGIDEKILLDIKEAIIINSCHGDPLFLGVDPPRLRAIIVRARMMDKNTKGY